MRAPEQPRGCPSAIAPPLRLTLSSGILRLLDDGQGLCGKGFIEFPDINVVHRETGSCESLWVAGTGPMPIRVGSTPAEALAKMRARGCRPWAAAKSSDASSRAQAPSLRVEELPAVTEPPVRKAGLSLASFSKLEPARGPSSCENTTGGPSALRNFHRDNLVVEVAGCLGSECFLVGAQRETILVFTRDAVVVHKIFSGTAHGLQGKKRFHFGVGVSPAEAGIVGHEVARLGRDGSSRHGVGSTGHGLHPTSDEEVSVTDLDRARGLIDRFQA